MSNLHGVVIDAFLDGLTGAGLFGRLCRPGAPGEYVDSRTVEEFKASGEFDAILRRQGKAVSAMPTGRAGSGTKDNRTSAVAH